MVWMPCSWFASPGDDQLGDEELNVIGVKDGAARTAALDVSSRQLYDGRPGRCCRCEL